MRFVLWAGALFLAVSVSTLAAAQTKTDFSGKWVLAPGPANGVGGAGASGEGTTGRDPGGAKPICGQEFSIAVDVETLKIDRPLGDRVLKVTLKLDGSEIAYPAPLCRVQSPAMEQESLLLYEAMRRQGVSPDMISTAGWDRGGIVLQSSVDRARIRSKQVLTLLDPTTLIVETTSSMEGGPDTTVRATYRRQPR